MSRRSQPLRRDAAPVVNLLSAWVFEQIAVRRLRRRFLAAACVLVLVLASAWTLQHLRAGQARQVLAVERAETARLAAETQKLAPVRTYVAAVQQQEATVQGAMEHEILFSRILDGLQVATPAGARLDAATVTLPPPPAAAPVPAASAEGGDASAPTSAPAPAPPAGATGSICPGPDPFHTRAVVGCVTLSGTADSRDTVGRLVQGLAGVNGFVEPFISTTTTADEEQVTFTGSVGLSPRVYSHRFADVHKLLDREVAR